MRLQLLLQYGTLWSFIIAAIGVLIAIVSHHRQVNASVFLDLTSRLQTLYQKIPAESRSTYYTNATPSETAIVGVMDFLNLLNAAYTLHKSGYFSGPLWKALEAEAHQGLSMPLFRSAWPHIRQHFRSNPPFISYVDHVYAKVLPTVTQSHP